MLLRVVFSQFTPKTTFEPFATSWLKKHKNAFHNYLFTNPHYYDKNKKLALQTWFHSFFLVEILVLAEFFDLNSLFLVF